MSVQEIICVLSRYWAQQGCIILQPLDLPVGAGTAHPSTFFGALGKAERAAAYVQASRRATDGRYGENPNRLQKYYQFQVIFKPAPAAIQSLYLDSLEALGLKTKTHDIRFVEDNWENPSLGAWGVGWEVWLDGMEVTQFTYFQQVGGIAVDIPMVELTYGIERLAMYLQKCDNVYDLVWGTNCWEKVTYGDLFHQSEREHSAYNFKHADCEAISVAYVTACRRALELLKLDPPLVLPAYEALLDAIWQFNLLDARHAIAVSERQRYILELRSVSHSIASRWLEKAVPTDSASARSRHAN